MEINFYIGDDVRVVSMPAVPRVGERVFFSSTSRSYRVREVVYVIDGLSVNYDIYLEVAL